VPIATAPGALPLLGHFVRLGRDPLGFMDSLRGRGDLVEIKLGPLRFVVVCDPHLSHQVLTDLRTFDRTGPVYDRIRWAMGNGVASAVHGEHRRQRLIMQPAFHTRHLPGYAEVMRGQTAAMVEGWRDGQVVDLVEELFRLTTSIALQALFSAGLDAQDGERLREAFEVFLRGSYRQIVLPALSRLPLPANRRYQAALRQWRAQVQDLIERYRSSGGDQGDLMGRLLTARGEDGEGLSDEELSDQVAVLLIAGAETTSAALTWAIDLLCRHPEVLEAACAETDRVLGGETANWEHLPELDLTARVIQEALRLYPPSWLLPRTTTRETTLGGHVLPAGTPVMVSEYVLHHDPALFPAPDRFDPDRWSASGPSIDRRSYIPFGGGPTKCLGEQFASAEAVLVLASILAKWTPRLRDPHAAAKPDARIVLLPRHLMVRLAARA
jgi:pentalenene oxygenase